MKQKVYWTPRVVLMYVLNNEKHKNIARWIVKDQTFVANLEKIMVLWTDLLSESYVAQDLATRMNILREWHHGFYNDIFVIRNFRNKMTELRMVTKSTEMRQWVDDLDRKPLVEWIIRFLVEQTRVDWVQWTDEGSLAFEILDIQAMGEVYAKVHEKNTSCPVYYTRLILSSYCLNGMMKKIGKNTYKFDSDWYNKELERAEDLGNNDIDSRMHISCSMYPELTVEPELAPLEEMEGEQVHLLEL